MVNLIGLDNSLSLFLSASPPLCLSLTHTYTHTQVIDIVVVLPIAGLMDAFKAKTWDPL